jgi:hypothetical protein
MARGFAALPVNPSRRPAAPCSIVVYEDDEHRTVVSAVDPMQSMAAEGETPALRTLATLVREKLGRAISRIE